MKTMKDYSEPEVREALLDAAGNIAETALVLDVLYGELSLYIRRRPELLKLMERLPQVVVESAQDVLSEAVDLDQRWAIQFTLRTLGKKRGWGKFLPQPLKIPPPEDDVGDIARLDPDELVRHDFIHAKAAGFPDGIWAPDPDWVQRLDQMMDAVRSAFASQRYNTYRVAAKLEVTHDQLQEYLALRPELYEAVGDPREELLDRAVAGLLKAVIAKKAWAVTYALKTQGRALGFSENPYDEVPRQPPKALHAYDLNRLTVDEVCELDELILKKLGIPLPYHKQMEKEFREMRNKAGEKDWHNTLNAATQPGE
jgi:hypothetical protein